MGETLDTSVGFQNWGKYLGCAVPNEAVVCFLGACMPHCQAGILHERSNSVCFPSTLDGFWYCCGGGCRPTVMAVAQEANNGKVTCQICCYGMCGCITCSPCEVARLNSDRRNSSYAAM
jgi:hypothetical protein